MNNDDIALMSEAITLATGCIPVKESIPKVGAIIALEGATIGRGRRGTGRNDDDDHAELHALDYVKDKSLLPKATLYTTLEPCTRDVRSDPSKSCTELILQHKIPKVFIGILDPNQGVTGKGLWRLQDSGVEVNLFPHDFAQKVRAINVPFIRSQQTLGATILSPLNGERLTTSQTGGKHAVRFKSLNPPTNNNYLLSFRQGVCWPQPGEFRWISDDMWEIDAHFGATGDHTLQLVTATDLGKILMEYYRKVIRVNTDRRKALINKIPAIDPVLLGGDYTGISMGGLPKGIRLEASVSITIV